MFKRTLLQQARATRAVRTPSSSLLALGSGAAPRLSTLARPAFSVASLSRDIIARSYSSGASAAASSRNNDASSSNITRFADLDKLGVHPNIIRALVQDMGYETMTDVQTLSINPALAGNDIVAQARTGTGKTIGFLLPTIQRIIQANPALGERGNGPARPDDIKAIIISPTRELAEQIGVEARKLCRHTGLVVQTAVGGMHKSSMLRKTRMEGCHLLVATPGRLQDVLSDEYSGIDAPSLAALVLDEADRMLDAGFERELQQILRLLPDRSRVPRQTLLFSATIPKDVISLARTYVDASKFKFVQTIDPNEAPTHERVPQHIVMVPGFEHFVPALLELTEKAQRGAHGTEPFKAVVFCNFTDMVKMYADIFHFMNRHFPRLPPIFTIHSGLDQTQRTRAANGFRGAQTGILLSSDVTARGMDFPNVTHVIQFGVPPDREQYIHRLGRTGRANKTGQGWLIVRRAEVSHARRVLPGLPIKRSDDLTVAKVDTKTTDPDKLPKYFTATAEAGRRVNPNRISDAYHKFINGDKNRETAQDTVDDANWWIKSQMNVQELPPLSRRLMLGNPALRNVSNLRWREEGRPDVRRGASFGVVSSTRDEGPRRYGSRVSNDYRAGAHGYGGVRDGGRGFGGPRDGGRAGRYF